MHNIGICPRCHKPGAERIFKHIRRTPRVLSDDDFCFFPKTSAIIPAQKPTDADSMAVIQTFISFSAEPVGSEIFTHILIPFNRKKRVRIQKIALNIIQNPSPIGKNELRGKDKTLLKEYRRLIFPIRM